MGLSYTGISCLLTLRVSGYSLVPEPPANRMPFQWGADNVDLGGLNDGKRAPPLRAADASKA